MLFICSELLALDNVHRARRPYARHIDPAEAVVPDPALLPSTAFPPTARAPPQPLAFRSARPPAFARVAPTPDNADAAAPLPPQAKAEPERFAELPPPEVKPKKKVKKDAAKKPACKAMIRASRAANLPLRESAGTNESAGTGDVSNVSFGELSIISQGSNGSYRSEDGASFGGGNASQRSAAGASSSTSVSVNERGVDLIGRQVRKGFRDHAGEFCGTIVAVEEQVRKVAAPATAAGSDGGEDGEEAAAAVVQKRNMYRVQYEDFDEELVHEDEIFRNLMVTVSISKEKKKKRPAQ